MELVIKNIPIKKILIISAIFVLSVLLLSVVALLWASLTMLYSGIPSIHWFKVSFIPVFIDAIQTRELARYGFMSLMTIIGVPLIIFILLKVTKPMKRFGEARFATFREIKKYGYLQPEGIILGQMGNKLIMSHGPKTISLVAKPRSGKGVGFVVPNLLNWNGSAVVIDVKKELVELTSGFRAKHQDIYVFDPLDPDEKSHCINIFDGISVDANRRISDVKKIGMNLIQTGEKFWDAGGRNIFVATALFLLETQQHTSLGSVYRWVNSGGHLQEKMAAAMEQFENELSEECLASLGKFVNIDSEKTASGFIDTFNSTMEPFSNPLISNATDKSDFSFESLRETKATIYLVVRPEDLDQLGPLLGLICDQMIFALTRIRPEHGEMGSILFMLDEFTALGKLDRIKKGAAFLGGYGIRLAMIYQNKYQPETTYSLAGANELSALSHERIIYAPADIQEAEKYSRELGNNTVKVVNKSVSKGGTSRSYSEASKPLRSPDELMRLPEDDAIIFAAGQRPILCKKIKYYSDNRFIPRLLPEYQDVPALHSMDYKFIEIQMEESEELDEDLAKII